MPVKWLQGMALILLFFVFSSAAWAQGALASFIPGAADNAITLANPQDTRPETVADQTYACIKPDQDPYDKITWRFDLPGAKLQPDTEYGVEIEFLDIGAGVIEISVTADGSAWPVTRSESYTRLNTQRERRACYAFRTGSDTAGAARISVAGLQYLKALRIVPAYSEDQWAEAHAAVPRDVQPMAALRRPLDLVTTAGISATAYEPDTEAELQAIHNLAPLAKVLGFNAIEAYVRWRLIEPEKEGEFDFHYYDRLAAKLQEYDLKWFPLLIIGSAYALPDWFAESPENIGFSCLEHGISNPIQSIWSPYHRRHVERVLKAFGEHYEPTHTLLGVRLGPSGNYGESQYPAGGNWPLKGHSMHIHIGLWCADDYARADFKDVMRRRYGDITKLNAAWEQQFASFDDLSMPLPVQILSKRQRCDFLGWYTQSMTQWCEDWALIARTAMPNTPLYQSSGGWGFVEAGTSYSGQTKSMARVHGGIRLTNETDSFEQNINATRLAATAARWYGVDLGYEPASSHTARGVAARIFNTATTNGDHLFTYHPNVMYHQMAVDQWLKYLPVLDDRADPVVDTAVFYPETMNQLDDGAFRHLYAWGFNPRAAAVRRAVEVDYLDENLIRDGFLDHYKVLVFAWGEFIEADVLAMIDQWVRNGGCVIYPSFPRAGLTTVEGDGDTFRRWENGGTQKGLLLRFQGDMEPNDDYGRFVKQCLMKLDTLHPMTQAVLRINAPEKVFFSAQESGRVMALNYNEFDAEITLPEGRIINIPAYGIARFTMN